MEKYCLLIVCMLSASILLSGCDFKQGSKSPINYKRRLEQYLPKEEVKPAGGVVDLSEGPKLKYNANFGPKDLNFDIKIKNPY